MMTAQECIEAAQELAPLLRDKAREGEIARRPLDEVVEAAGATGLFSMMVPKRYGGYELDLDTFFEVVLILSEADPPMGWLIGFYIEHAFWLAEFSDEVQDEVYGDANHVLAPAALNIGGGTAAPVDGGYRVSGRWSWGTGIVHGTWVIAGCMATDAGGGVVPMMFLLPRQDVEAIDNWHIAGMCSTGSQDFAIDDVFVASERALPFLGMLDGSLGIGDRYDGALYDTPLIPILVMAAGVPCLGAARAARAAYSEQVKAKIEASGSVKGEASFGAIAEASFNIDAAELVFRNVLADIMARRNEASVEERSDWASRVTHAVHQCREATNVIASRTGASGAMLDNPIQRFARDINTAANHIVFERESRYGDHTRQLLGQPITNPMV